MEAPLLIDTNIFIDQFRGHKPATAFFNQTGTNLCFSAITETELLVGKENDLERNRENLLNFLSQLKKIDVGNPLAKKAGDLCRQYQMEVPDAIIAATTLSLNGVLVTRNVKHFKKVKGLRVKVPY